MGSGITEFQRIISIRVPEINKDQNLLRNYYYTIIEKFLPKTENNIKSLKFVFDEAENFFIVIDGVKFIIKYGGIFYDCIEEFEIYIFQQLLSKSTFNMNVDLIPVMLTLEDRETIMQKANQIYNKIEDYDRRCYYYEMMNIYKSIKNYFIINITTYNEKFILDKIQN